MRSSAIWLTILLLAPTTQHAEQAPMRNGLISLNFSRSGGMVALGNPPSGEVTLTNDAATLRSEGAPDGRPLSAAETAMLEALDPAALRAWHPPAHPSRDLRTTTVTLRFQTGAPIILSFTEPPNATAPGTEAIGTWVGREAEIVWQHRLHQ